MVVYLRGALSNLEIRDNTKKDSNINCSTVVLLILSVNGERANYLLWTSLLYDWGSRALVWDRFLSQLRGFLHSCLRGSSNPTLLDKHGVEPYSLRRLSSEFLSNTQ